MRKVASVPRFGVRSETGFQGSVEKVLILLGGSQQGCETNHLLKLAVFAVVTVDGQQQEKRVYKKEEDELGSDTVIYKFYRTLNSFSLGGELSGYFNPPISIVSCCF